MQRAQRVLWFPTCGLTHPPSVYVDAAVACGVPEISLPPDPLTDLSDSELRRIADHARSRSVTVSVVDAVHAWLPLDDARAARLPTVAGVLRVAEALGARDINALAVKVDLDVAGQAECFARLCDTAAEQGARVHLEFSPLGGVVDLAHAWEVVALAGRDNGGVLLDTWHFHRAGPDLDLLARIPGDRVFAVQVADAGERPVGSVWNDTLHHRRLPGDGVADLGAVLATLARTGGLTRYGPEVISDARHALGPAAAAETAFARTDALVGVAFADAGAAEADSTG